jgi:hypothetical protein
MATEKKHKEIVKVRCILPFLSLMDFQAFGLTRANSAQFDGGMESAETARVSLHAIRTCFPVPSRLV